MDEPGRPAFDESPHRLATGTDPRRLYAIIGVLLVVIVVLTIRPWGDDAGLGGAGAGPSGAARVPATPVAPPPLTEPPIGVVADIGVTCASPSGWRAATLQAWAGRDRPIRSWIAIDPVAADGALDPGIPFVPVATGVVTAIGYCAPPADDRRPPEAIVASLWAILDGRAVPLTLLPIEPASPDPLGGLWAPPPEVLGRTAAADSPSPAPAASPGAVALWPPGRYVVELATPDRSYARWLGLELWPAPLPPVTRSPPPSPIQTD